MGKVIVNKPFFTAENGYQVASANILINGVSSELKYKVSGGPIAYGTDAFFAASLPLAMKVGQPLLVEGEVSPKLLHSAQTIQEIFHKWYPELKKIPIEAVARKVDSSKDATIQDVGCFFSGGLDSFYTLLKHRDEITKLIFVHGADIHVNDHEMRARVSEALQRTAAALSKQFIEVECKLNEFSSSYGLSWPYHYFGAALASVALMLSPQFKKIYIASSETYAHLDPCGSHPLLDPLWGTEDMEIIHDGCEANRIEKAARIGHSTIALKTLRVCWQNLKHQSSIHGDKQIYYNCGRCEKCVRTMINLYAVGALNRCSTFDCELDIDNVSMMEIDHDLVYYHVEDNIKAIEEKENNGALVKALRECLNRYDNKKFSQGLRKNLSSLVDSSSWEGLKYHLFASFFNNNRTWLTNEVIRENLKFYDRKLLGGSLHRLYRKLKEK